MELKKGVIRESQSQWSAAATLVPKISSVGKQNDPFIFRFLNKVNYFDM
jgi:hypothetical protein